MWSKREEIPRYNLVHSIPEQNKQFKLIRESMTMENLDEQLEFLQEHGINSENLILDDIRKQNRSVYKKFFTKKIL